MADYHYHLTKERLIFRDGFEIVDGGRDDEYQKMLDDLKDVVYVEGEVDLYADPEPAPAKTSPPESTPAKAPEPRPPSPVVENVLMLVEEAPVKKTKSKKVDLGKYLAD